MIIKNLSLSYFRSYPKRKFKFSPNISVILGPNASGKTNILEAIFFLSTGKSFRADSDREMISFDKELSRVKGEINQLSNNPTRLPDGQVNTNNPIGKIDLEILLTIGEVMGIKTPIKKYSVNGVGKRMLDFIGNLKTVLFWPEDMELVTDSPGRRRKYLDFILIQIDREYRRCLTSYEKGIRHRNKVLEAIRDEGAHRVQLIFWDQLIIKNGQYISRKREEYITFLNNFKIQSSRPKADQPLAENSKIPIFQLEYDRSEISEARLRQYAEEEIAAGVTLVGPHRDDFKFKVQSSNIKTNIEELRDLSHYGSRGEQRLAILWLKIGELTYVEQISAEKPVLLLDDIFSELDHEHREIVFDIIGDHQTIMTTTDLHHIEKKILEKVEIITLA